MMYYYELKNTKTGHCLTATAKSTKDAIDTFLSIKK